MKNNFREEILAKIQSMKEIPVLPTTIYKVIDISKNPDSSALDLSKILEKDQALTTKVLKLANSSYYGFSNKISTISHAIVCLGFDTITSIALTAQAFEVLKRPNKAYMLDEGKLFHHSISVALASKLIAQKVKYHDPEEAFVGGLLHDIGKLIVNIMFLDKFNAVIDLTKEKDITFLDAEREILGIDHAELGFILGKHWNLPNVLCEAALWHHEPEKYAPADDGEDNRQIVDIIHVGNAMAMMTGVSLGIDGLNNNMSTESLENLNMSGTDLELMLAQLSELIKEEEALTS
jgi:putative nucleotidyltransferase with HDIG domain